ncbi:3501_t:CDS:1, partial [Racocetra persica]
KLLAPRKQRRGSQKPPRAQNKFILYRKDYTARIKKENPNRAKLMKTQDFSKEASYNWDSQSTDVKQFFTVLADTVNTIHKATYPGYVYEPEKREKQVKDEYEELFEEIIDSTQCS